jgi:omega-6 fatty acid desaturase (delta-12 desaturase)
MTDLRSPTAEPFDVDVCADAEPGDTVSPRADPPVDALRATRAQEAVQGALANDVAGTSSGTDASPRGRDGSLNAVRAIIPDECYRRPTGRAVRALAQASVLYLAAIVGLAFTNTWWLLVILWPLAGMGVSGLFVLGHDASHGALVGSRRANLYVARACMLPSLHLESAWDLGHNRIHHGYTTRQGFDFVWHPVTVEEYRAMGPFGRLRHRWEWSWIGSGAYFLRVVWWQKMLRFRANERLRRPLRMDRTVVGVVAALATVVTATFGVVVMGPIGAIWMPFKLLAVPFLLFIHIIGFTVYVHHVAPEIRWWRRRDWSQFKGQMESTTVLRTPWLVNRLWLHNIFIHVPHHVDVRIPFHQLPRAARAIMASFPETVRSSRLSLRSYWRTTSRCKLYDFEQGRWLPYQAART